MPDNGCYQMFRNFHCHPHRYFMIHTTTWTSCVWSKVHSYPAKWYEGNSSKYIYHIVFFKKWPFCRESQRNVNQKEQPLISFTLESCEEYYYNSNDQELVYEYIDFPAKAVIITNVNWKLHIKSQSKNPRTLPFSVMPTPTHFIHLNTCHWWI